MTDTPACPLCTMENTYPDRDNVVCADCGHEWSMHRQADTPESGTATVRDANGTTLSDGDSVVLIKDLKAKGGSTLKIGTKAKNIRLIDGDHEVDVRIDGIGYLLKACYLRKTA